MHFARFSLFIREASLPLIRIVPLSGFTIPRIHFKRVVFPAPLGPTILKTSPFFSSMLTSSKTLIFLYLKSSPLMLSISVFSCPGLIITPATIIQSEDVRVSVLEYWSIGVFHHSVNGCNVQDALIYFRHFPHQYSLLFFISK